MNDVEDLLREELRARVDAAEAALPDTGLRLIDIDARIRRARFRRRWTGAALSAVAAAAAIALPLALLSPGSPSRVGHVTPEHGVPLTDTAATPSGWATVAHGDAQISVPPDWQVSSKPMCGRAAPGNVVLGTDSTLLVVRCRHAQNMAAILLEPDGRKLAGGFGTSINGIAVVPITLVPSPAGSVSYYVPALHVTVTATGPLARRVLATLTRSPLSVVLAPGPRIPEPRSWRWHEFRGIRFAAPRGWALVRNGHWGCSPASATEAVILIPAANFQRPRCAAIFPTAGQMAGHVGVIAAVGSYRGADSAGHGACRSQHGLRVCYLTPAFDNQMLDVAAYIPGRDRVTLLQIGLGGSGAIPRTIFQSIRPR